MPEYQNYPAPLRSQREWLEEMDKMYNEAKAALVTAEFYNFDHHRMAKLSIYTALAQAAATAAQAANG